MNARLAKFAIGQVVRHRIFPFRGVIFDVDPEFSNTDEWWESIPEDIRPRKDQPFYHLLAENNENTYVAYVSEQNLLPDDSGEPVGHPHASLIFEGFEDGHYNMRPRIAHSARTRRHLLTVIPDGPKGRSGTQIESEPICLNPNLGPGSPLNDSVELKPRTILRNRQTRGAFERTLRAERPISSP
jgi:heat shock protein HspQ